MSAAGLLLASSVVAFGSLLQGAVGFGLALVSVPFLVLIDPRLVPGPVLLSSSLLTVLMAVRERHAIHVAGIGWGVIGRLPGTAAGALVIGAIPLARMDVALGALVLVAVLLSASGLRMRPTAPALVGAGALSGFMGTVSSIGGPPMALVYQNELGARLRGTLAAYFVIGAVLSLGALAIVGRFGSWELLWGFALMPGVGIGFAVSGRLARFVDRGYTRPAVLAVSAAAALLVIARHAF
jgi:uncharacterized membrane protein YfcA